MRIEICFLFFVIAAASVFGQESAANGEQTIVSDERYVITYKVKPKEIIFTMDDLRASESSKTSEKMPGSYFYILVDVNRNGRVDENKDVVYNLMKNSISLCSQYLIDERASTQCGGLVSNAIYEVSSRRTEHASYAHIVHRYTIPLSEIRTPGQKALNVVFHCSSEGDVYFAPKAFYPALESPNAINSFTQTITIKL